MRVSVRRASTVLIHCVVPEHIHTPPPPPPPPPPHGRSLEIPKGWGGGGLKGRCEVGGLWETTFTLVMMRVTNHEQNIESNVQSIKTKVSTPGH